MATRAIKPFTKKYRKIEPPSAEEEIELVQKIRRGDEEAKKELIIGHHRLGIQIGRKYNKGRLPFEDMFQDTMVGMIKSLNKYDETRGFRFMAYAKTWIKKTIEEDYAKNFKSEIRRPSDHNLTEIEYNKTLETIFNLYETENIPPDEIERIHKLLHKNLKGELKYFLKGLTEKVLPLNPVSNFEREPHLIDVIEDPSFRPEKKDYQISRNYASEFALNQLIDKREREIIEKYYGLNGHIRKNMNSLSEEFEVSRERIRQLKEKALRKMQTPKIRKKILEYLGKN